MRVSRKVRCETFPCAGVRHEAYRVPPVDVKSDRVSIIMISECAAGTAEDDFYARGDPLFARTTIQAFRDAGAKVGSMADLLAQGVYVTTAVKCGKIGYAVPTGAIGECSRLLEQELALFPNARVLLPMGDVAIRAVNAIARRAGEPRVIPPGSTYKIRSGTFRWRGMRVFPSYLQAGPSFFIERSKRKMIAQDIAAALRLVGKAGGSRARLARLGPPRAE